MFYPIGKGMGEQQRSSRGALTACRAGHSSSEYSSSSSPAAAAPAPWSAAPAPPASACSRAALSAASTPAWPPAPPADSRRQGGAGRCSAILALACRVQPAGGHDPSRYSPTSAAPMSRPLTPTRTSHSQLRLELVPNLGAAHALLLQQHSAAGAGMSVAASAAAVAAGSSGSSGSMTRHRSCGARRYRQRRTSRPPSIASMFCCPCGRGSNAGPGSRSCGRGLAGSGKRASGGRLWGLAQRGLQHSPPPEQRTLGSGPGLRLHASDSS